MVLSDDLRKRLRADDLKDRRSEADFFHRVQLFQLALALGGLCAAGLLFDDFAADLFDVFLVPFFKAVFDLFLERALDGLTGEYICDLVLQLVQDGGDLFICRLAMVVAAFQNEALHADETALGIFVMNIFHGIESARLHDQLLGPHRGGIDAVDRIQLAVQLLV